MNKRELVNAVAAQTGVDKKQVDVVLSGFTDVVSAVKMLEEAGVVTRVIDGRTHRLALRPEKLAETSDWIESQRERWERLFDVVGDYLDERKERG